MAAALRSLSRDSARAAFASFFAASLAARSRAESERVFKFAVMASVFFFFSNGRGGCWGSLVSLQFLSLLAFISGRWVCFMLESEGVNRFQGDGERERDGRSSRI